MKLFNRIFGIQEISGADLLTAQQLQQQQQSPEPEPELTQDAASFLVDGGGPTPIANLNLVLFNNGTMQIMADWGEQSSGMASTYGKFLYHIFNGDIEDSVLQQLAIYANNDIVQQDFISNIVESLRDIQAENSNSPVVSPSQALKIPTPNGPE